MSWFGDFYKSAVGKKAVMAVSGIILFGFVLVHMIGNLKLYEGPKLLNSYAGFLRSVGSPAIPTSGLLWIARLVLLAAVVLHMWAAWQLTLMNRQARPAAYARRDVVHTTYASRTMRWGGIIILLFVVYHLLDLTWGVTNPAYIEKDVYHNVVASFSRWWISLFYIVAQLALGLHLYHGLWSMFQSLGWNHPRFNRWRSGFAHAFAWIITLGNISFPLAVLAGWVR
ncbi:MAG: succinate dehydrogenase / fumarate reductase, cytochrome b subunit [Acidobacteriota bacterium]|jgi:succinate dehydrogenase / fumarate reductase cytochrome b subunit|nr:succinate dehydrogenase / fumarate reductase, cytochrome b subunit [Acidobacteriota bacterium]